MTVTSLCLALVPIPYPMVRIMIITLAVVATAPPTPPPRSRSTDKGERSNARHSTHRDQFFTAQNAAEEYRGRIPRGNVPRMLAADSLSRMRKGVMQLYEHAK